jgi:hypothetical protein
MATGFPAATGDVLSAAMFNGLVAFTINNQSGSSYTLTSTDQYQVQIVTSNASASAIKIPTESTYNFGIGTVVTVLNKGAGTCTVSAVSSGTTTVLSAGATPAAPTLGQYKSCAIEKISAETWVVVGAIA